MMSGVVALAGVAFLLTLGLCAIGLYVLVERPAARRRLQARLSSVQQSLGPSGPGGSLLRDDALSDVPALNRLLLNLPPVLWLQATLTQAGMTLPAGTLLALCGSLGLLALLTGLLLGMPVLLLPLLVGATVFVCTGYLGKEFWWDELDRLVHSSPSELHALHLQVGEKLFQWEHSNGSPTLGAAKMRQEFRHALYQFILPLPVEDQERAMSVVRSWARTSTLADSAPRSMDQDEIRQLAEGGLIEIGAHSRHHPMLPKLSIQKQEDEIASSKRDLENVLGKQIKGFAYPNGRTTPDAKRLVREAGFATHGL